MMGYGVREGEEGSGRDASSHAEVTGISVNVAQCQVRWRSNSIPLFLFTVTGCNLGGSGSDAYSFKIYNTPCTAWLSLSVRLYSALYLAEPVVVIQLYSLVYRNIFLQLDIGLGLILDSV